MFWFLIFKLDERINKPRNKIDADIELNFVKTLFL